MSRLKLSNLKVGRETTLFSATDIELSQGEVTVFLGKNGAGKTTFFKSLLGMISFLSGEIEYQGASFFSLTIMQRAQLISYLLTNQRFDMFLTVTDLLRLGRYPYQQNWSQFSEHDHQIIDEYVTLFDLHSFLDKRINELSDGERQRCLLARTFIQDTPFIILDEPGSYLDVKHKLELFLTIKQIAQKKNKTIIFSTHDIEVCSKLFNHLWLIDSDNRMLLSGGLEILESEAFHRTFSSDQFYFDQKSQSFTFC